VLRATLLLLILGCLAITKAHADDAVILPGSGLTLAEALAKSDFVFEAKLTDLGSAMPTSNGKYLGPTYHGAQAGGLSYYKDHAPDPVHLAINLNDTRHETAPVVGQNYIFFVRGPPQNGEYFVMKMLPATMESRRATLRAVMAEKKQPEVPVHEPTAAQQ